MWVPMPRKPPIDRTAYGSLPSRVTKRSSILPIVSFESLRTLLGRPIDGRHLLHIDLGDLNRLWDALCLCVCGEHANRCSTGKQHCFLHDYSPWLVGLNGWLVREIHPSHERSGRGRVPPGLIGEAPNRRRFNPAV